MQTLVVCAGGCTSEAWARENQRSRDRKCGPGRTQRWLEHLPLPFSQRVRLTRAHTQLVSEIGVGLHVFTLLLTASCWAGLSLPGPAPSPVWAPCLRGDTQSRAGGKGSNPGVAEKPEGPFTAGTCGVMALPQQRTRGRGGGAGRPGPGALKSVRTQLRGHHSYAQEGLKLRSSFATVLDVEVKPHL